MRWLLISTLNKNPGDEFIRIGVQNIIRDIDPQPEFRVIDKEDEYTWTPGRFDRAIWCGMPLFWNFPGNENRTIYWWRELIMGWVSAEPRKFLVYGAGTFFTQEIHQANRLRESVAELQARSWHIVMRDNCLEELGLKLDVMPCPAIFAARSLPAPDEKQLKLCNIMPDGSHYANLWPEQAKAWREKAPELGRQLIEAGFEAVAHNQVEAKHARDLGFPTVHDLPSQDIKAGLRLYSRCRRYFGNRLHGGVLSRAAGAQTWVVGYDTRLRMAQLCGAATSTPTETTPENLSQWIDRDQPGLPPPIDDWEHHARQLIEQFAADGN